ncbi:PaaI family thioesterase [Microlunatus elymi]|uniref:PaaI family thioesterase n=1 Tax=Microlunatus elymi TaxID=2596828 RepID=A0A516Q0G6_9ACTN|nr:PaaI family thioesterase [Microlunatus elymi]QDP96897.1 PaaI family thioesterase [Microlunatus elymi]
MHLRSAALILVCLLQVSRVHVGRCAFPPRNAIGTVHGGVIASWLDTAMGYAIQSRLDIGISLTTLDIQVRYLRAIQANDPPLRVIGTAEHVGRTTATARAEVLDDQDRRLATATTSCLILRRD